MAYRSHVAPHQREMLAVQEHCNIHGALGVKGFTSSRAVSVMRAARRDSCWLLVSRGVVVGGSGSLSEASAACETSRTLRLSMSPCTRYASLVAVPWEASTSMCGG